jgi:hypothetical protein
MRTTISAAASAVALLVAAVPAQAADEPPLSFVVPQSSPWVNFGESVRRMCLVARSLTPDPVKPGEPPVASALAPEPRLPPCRKQRPDTMRATGPKPSLSISLPATAALTAAWQSARGRPFVRVRVAQFEQPRFAWQVTLPGRRGRLLLRTTYTNVYFSSSGTATVQTDWLLRVVPARGRR